MISLLRTTGAAFDEELLRDPARMRARGASERSAGLAASAPLH
jgi:hypothetical protein